MIPTPSWGKQEGSHQKLDADHSVTQESAQKEDKLTSQMNGDRKGYHGHSNGTCQNHSVDDEPRTPNKTEALGTEDMDEQSPSDETTVWIRCDVYDTGIGIPGMFYPVIFISNKII